MGPILFVDDDRIPEATRNELVRSAPSEIVLVGGSGRISPRVEAELRRTFPDTRVVRLGGADRTATSVEVSRHRWSASDHAYVVGFDAPADALVATGQGKPVLFVHRFRVPVSTLSELERLGVTQVTIVGGAGRVSSAVEKALLAGLDGLTVRRVSGPDRFSTARLLAEHTPDLNAGVFVAAGAVTPEGFVSEFAARRTRSPLVLTGVDCLPIVSAAMIGNRTTTIIGAVDESIRRRTICAW